MKKPNGADKSSRILKAKDLLKLATRCGPSTPVAVHTSSGAEIALYDAENTGLGELDLGGEPMTCIVISSVEPK